MESKKTLLAIDMTEPDKRVLLTESEEFSLACDRKETDEPPTVDPKTDVLDPTVDDPLTDKSAPKSPASRTDRVPDSPVVPRTETDPPTVDEPVVDRLEEKVADPTTDTPEVKTLPEADTPLPI